MSAARVPGGQLHEVVKSVVRERHAERAHPSLGIDHGELQEAADLLGLERLEAQEQAPGQERAHQAVVRVLGGGADQRDRAVLDRGEQDLLLRLVPPVDLVDEQDRSKQRRLRVIHHAARVRDAGAHRRELLEVRADRDGEQMGQCRLPRPGWTPQDRRGKVATVDQLGERLPLTEEVVMPDELLEVARAHPRRERSIHEGGIPFLPAVPRPTESPTPSKPEASMIGPLGRRRNRHRA